MKKIFVVVIILAFVVVVTIVHHQQFVPIAQFVASSGYVNPKISLVHNIHLIYFGCGKHDNAAYLVEATDRSGQRVKNLVVCSAYPSGQLTLHRR